MAYPSGSASIGLTVMVIAAISPPARPQQRYDCDFQECIQYVFGKCNDDGDAERCRDDPSQRLNRWMIARVAVSHGDEETNERANKQTGAPQPYLLPRCQLIDERKREQQSNAYP